MVSAIVASGISLAAGRFLTGTRCKNAPILVGAFLLASLEQHLKEDWMRWWIVVFWFSLVLFGCGSAAEPTDPFLVTEGPFRVHLTTAPQPLHAGEDATFTITVVDATNGKPVQDVTVRPVGDMKMPDGMSMYADLSAVEEVEPGQFRTRTRFDHGGLLRFSVSVARGSVVTPLTFPEIEVQP
jgi:hypothetical protein